MLLFELFRGKIAFVCLQATDVELKNFVKRFEDLSTVPQTGVDLENVHYVVPLVEDDFLFGKKGKNGICAKKTASGEFCGPMRTRLVNLISFKLLYVQKESSYCTSAQ